jgi:hypothetical protein
MTKTTDMTPKRTKSGFELCRLSPQKQHSGIFNAIENAIGLQRRLTISTDTSLPFYKQTSVSKEQIATLESKITVLEQQISSIQKKRDLFNFKEHHNFDTNKIK